MKGFGNYQYVGIREMTERDERESRSKFWNKGKWDNFVKPFLPKNCKDMILVDVGCGAGLFLKLAEDLGFKKVIGIEANREAFRIAQEYRKRNGGKYELHNILMQKSLDRLPFSDITVLANVHYYLTISELLAYLDKIKNKTRLCIIVAREKIKGYSMFKAPPDIESLRSYFSEWEEVGAIDNIPLDGDPAPRKLSSICFKNKIYSRVDLNKIILSSRGPNKVFYDEVEQSIPPEKTQYFKWLQKESISRKYWSGDSIRRYVKRKIKLYYNIKSNYIIEPIIINSKNEIIDGNHRCEIMKYLGHKSILARKVI